MKVLVTGDRNWTDHALIWTVLDGYFQIHEIGHLTVTDSPFILIEGGAKGADTIAGKWADNSPLHYDKQQAAKLLEERHIETTWVEHFTIKADWQQYGKRAGPIRNREMLQLEPDLVLAFHDDIRNSKGTKDMCLAATKALVPVILVQHFSKETLDV